MNLVSLKMNSRSYSKELPELPFLKILKFVCFYGKDSKELLRTTFWTLFKGYLYCIPRQIIHKRKDSLEIHYRNSRNYVRVLELLVLCFLCCQRSVTAA